MQTGGLWKELQTARSGLSATIRAPRTGSPLDTLQPPSTDFSLPLFLRLFVSIPFSHLNAPAFPERVPTSFAAHFAASLSIYRVS